MASDSRGSSFPSILFPHDSDLFSVNKSAGYIDRMFGYRPFPKASRAGDKASEILALAAIY